MLIVYYYIELMSNKFLYGKKEHVPLYITIIHIDNDNQGCEPLILLKSK